MENNDYSKLGDHDNCLEKITTKIHRVITKLIHLVSKDLKKLYEILEFCTEQEITFVEIFWSNKILSSLPKTGIFSHQSERSIFSEKTSEKSYCSDSHCSKSSRSFCSTSHFSKSAKSKAPSSYISKTSEKKPSAYSNLSYCATGSSSASYLSAGERRKNAKHLKLPAREIVQAWKTKK